MIPANVLARAYELRKTGLHYEEISAQLFQENLRRPTGKMWGQADICKKLISAYPELRQKSFYGKKYQTKEKVEPKPVKVLAKTPPKPEGVKDFCRAQAVFWLLKSSVAEKELLADLILTAASDPAT